MAGFIISFVSVCAPSKPCWPAIFRFNPNHTFLFPSTTTHSHPHNLLPYSYNLDDNEILMQHVSLDPG